MLIHKLLLHFEEPTDGTAPDGSFEIIDSGNTGHIVTQEYDAALQTTIVQFGSSAIDFDGTDDEISMPDSGDWYFGTGDFTISYWYNLGGTSVVGTDSFMGQSSTSVGGLGFTITTNASLDLRFWADYSGGWDIEMTASAVVETTGWHWVVIARDGSDVGMYHDGVQVKYESSSDSLGGSGNRMYIGDTSSGSQFLNGIIDDVVISHSNVFSASPVVGLTDTSLSTLPTEAFTPDANTKLLLHMDTQDVSGDGGSGSYHILNYTNDAHVDTDLTKWDAGAAKFDGTNDAVTIPDSNDWNLAGDTTSDWTVEYWVYHTSVANSTYELGHYDSAGGNNLWAIGMTSVGPYQRFDVWDDSTNHVDMTSDVVTSTGTWYHVAVIKVGNDWGLYQDGELVDSDIDVTGTVTFDDDLILGLAYAETGDFSGYMDEVRIQSSNYFDVDPNTDGGGLEFTPPTEAYSVAVVGGRRIIKVTKFTPEEIGGGWDRFDGPLTQNLWLTLKESTRIKIRKEEGLDYPFLGGV